MLLVSQTKEMAPGRNAYHSFFKLMTNKDLILNFLTNIKADLVDDLHTKKISDGDLGMKVDGDDKGGDLSGDAHWYYTVHGRKPGKQPPPETIIEWIRRKGIVVQGIITKSLAFLIGRKIGKLGTDIYLGKRPGLALEQIIKHNSEQFVGDLREKYLEDFRKAILQDLKQVFA